jgi:hypothetical protein
MKLRNIIAFATVMALLAVPFPDVASADPYTPYTPEGIPAATIVGELYEFNLRDYLGPEFDPWFDGSDGYFINRVSSPAWDWIEWQGAECLDPEIASRNWKVTDGHLTLTGTPTQTTTVWPMISFETGTIHAPTGRFATIMWRLDVIADQEASEINMLAGDTFSYQLEANYPAVFEVARGDLSAVGLTLSGDTISGTAALGRQSIIVRATSTEGPIQVTFQIIDFAVYRPLMISGTIQPTNLDGQSYSSQITVTDVDPDATGEVSLSLNQAAIDAGFEITRGSDTSWALTRTSAAFVSGTVPITITATTNAGGIQQTKTLTGTVNSYYDVKFTTTPSGHRGTGLNVWLIEGDGVWTYRPEAGPAGTTISVSGLVSGITWAGGVLTVTPDAPLDTTTVTITATSPDGYSSTTQVLTVTIWDKLVFTSRPSVENIITTVDGRNVTATVQASYYATILWDMGDGTTYEGNETIMHEYAEYGQYTITATALHVLGYTAEQSVDVRVSPPSVTDGLRDMWPFVALIGALFVMIALFAMMRG